MATQAAVMAGFTTTCLVELNIPDSTSFITRSLLHCSAIISISANITCVSLSTITNIWGSSKALRGKDGSMDEAVEGINNERDIIFRCFSIGLLGNLLTIFMACLIIMSFPVNLFGAFIVSFTAFFIYTNFIRIQKKFYLNNTVRLDDLTSYNPTYYDKNSNDNSDNNNESSSSDHINHHHNHLNKNHVNLSYKSLLNTSSSSTNRVRRSALDIV